MKKVPLAERLRPQNFKEIYGQEHLLGKKGIVTHLIQQETPQSIILWGPPGTGKTTIARLYAQAFGLRFESISPIFSGVADIKRIVQEAGSETIVLFVDEIHRFNKGQQDAFLPAVESGQLILVGSTVENPSFYLTKALLSRVQVLTLNALDEKALMKILKRYEKSFGPLKQLDAATRGYLIQLSHGDGRYLLNLIETIQKIKEPLDVEAIQALLQEKAPLFDKDTDQHYNLISALHKSVRGSDPDAALYWFSRMLVGGEEPLYIARRLIRMAVEDIGLADPHALGMAIAARDAFQMLGSPEGELALAQVVVYLALAPKSNAVYIASQRATQLATETNHYPPPKIILNAPTPLMRDLGYGEGYLYDPSTPEGFSGQNYFPEDMKRPTLYKPTMKGFEKEMKERLDSLTELRKSIQKKQKRAH